MCSPGRSKGASSPRAVTAIIAVWCHRKIVIADRFISATFAQARGRRMARSSGPRSSRASPHWARPKATAASVGGFRFDIGAPGTPTMDAGYPPHRTSPKAAAAPPPTSSAAGVRRANAPRDQAAPRV